MEIYDDLLKICMRAIIVNENNEQSVTTWTNIFDHNYLNYKNLNPITELRKYCMHTWSLNLEQNVNVFIEYIKIAGWNLPYDYDIVNIMPSNKLSPSYNSISDILFGDANNKTKIINLFKTDMLLHIIFPSKITISNDAIGLSSLNGSQPKIKKLALYRLLRIIISNNPNIFINKRKSMLDCVSIFRKKINCHKELINIKLIQSEHINNILPYEILLASSALKAYNNNFI
jgi:hypothetical protein